MTRSHCFLKTQGSTTDLGPGLCWGWMQCLWVTAGLSANWGAPCWVPTRKSLAPSHQPPQASKLLGLHPHLGTHTVSTCGLWCGTQCLWPQEWGPHSLRNGLETRDPHIEGGAQIPLAPGQVKVLGATPPVIPCRRGPQHLWPALHQGRCYLLGADQSLPLAPLHRPHGGKLDVPMGLLTAQTSWAACLAGDNLKELHFGFLFIIFETGSH